MTECEYRILQISGRTLQPELMQFFSEWLVNYW